MIIRELIQEAYGKFTYKKTADGYEFGGKTYKSEQEARKAEQNAKLKKMSKQGIGEVARVWSRTGGKQTRKYRCTHGHRKGRVMSSPAACNAPINVKKSVGLSTLKSKRGKTMANQSKITRRTNPASMRLPRLNKPKKTPFGRKKFK
tara:strand:- start:548 stop:988 length:441 start_codon:yes stop_codon:yes gene_type:complete